MKWLHSHPGLALFTTLLLLILTFGIGLIFKRQTGSQSPESTYRLLSLGDSYSIGEGATYDTSWPAVLARRLQQSGVDVSLLPNPSVTGYTTQDLINEELPLVERLHPTHVTIMIGVNDWVRGVSAEAFAKNLEYIITTVNHYVPSAHITLVTIPDFSVMPSGAYYGGGRDISSGLATFNTGIISAASAHHIAVVDVYGLSQKLASDAAMIAPDGLHPSARQYALWEEKIYPVMKPQFPLTPTQHQ